MLEQDLAARCRESVRELNRHHGWGLSDQQIDAYVTQLLQRVPANTLATRMELVISSYHADHRRVATLQDSDDPQHAATWSWVEAEIIRVARLKGLSWSRDPLLERDDLVQVVLVEVVRSLPDYHFASSLRTWLLGVTIRRLQRLHRDNAAAKRDGQPIPIDSAPEQTQAWDASEQPILASVLAAEIRRILAATGDRRYAQIMLLKALGDLSDEEIGKRLHLHPSRIRALMKQAREILRSNPGLRRWKADGADDQEQEQE